MLLSATLGPLVAGGAAQQPSPATSSDTAVIVGTVFTARKAYIEAAFGFGNLTPFVSPFNLAVHFTWPLSSYPTRRFQVGIRATRP
jgi:hypothetical protein